MKLNKFFQLITAIIISELAGIVGSVFTVSAIPTWYATLAKPVLNPPSWVFAPVWTMLYFLMGVAVFLVWREGWRRHDVKIALGFFGAQIILNALWSILFFGMQSPFLALIEIIALWLAIIATAFAFYRVSRFATYLLLPYILWVSFAAYLNLAIWILN